MRRFNENWDGVVRSSDTVNLHEVVASMPKVKAGNLTFQSFQEGRMKGWLIMQDDNTEVGFLEMPAKGNTKTSFSPVKLFIWSAPVRGASGGSGTEGQPRHVLSLYPINVSGELRTAGPTGIPRTLYDKPSNIPARTASWLAQNKSVWSHRVKGV